MKAPRFLLLYILLFTPLLVYPQSAGTGIFTGFTHIGSPEKQGQVLYDPQQQQYTLEGASGNMWFAHDDFHFLWKKIKGDFILQARVSFMGKGVEPHRKVGWMIRHSLESNSPHVNGVVHGDGLTSLQYRKLPGGMTEEEKSPLSAPDVLQVERKGNQYILSVARFGEPYTKTVLKDVSLGDDVYVGLFLCSHNETVSEKAIMRNVRIIVPAKDDFIPYRDYIGSAVETMEAETGLRKVVYTHSGSLQAPNWSADGKSLIYNHNGLLYNLNLDTGSPTVIDTKFADKNNNDHVLSFDGKTIGISHNNKDDNGNSIVYTVPLEGGTPKRVTPNGPSYLHGWSPDGKFLLYTGGRNGNYDIYKIRVTGGKEIRLTTAQGLDDGSEYTPDGKYIYFNSSRSGTMQIWRMKPDGSKQEQITSDDYNNWFPHISPDGKWIAFLSFTKDVAPEDHPFYKHVYLRLMPVSGGTPRIIAYVYGGQATINVPSWSPDSKRIAFVSNTD